VTGLGLRLAVAIGRSSALLAGGVRTNALTCRLYFPSSTSTQRGHPGLPSRGDSDNGAAHMLDQKLGHSLTLTQLGKWQDAATSLCELNKFFKEQYDDADRRTPGGGGVPPDHVNGKAQLVLEEWIHCLKQLNRCVPSGDILPLVD
jgi:hypothetical protein